MTTNAHRPAPPYPLGQRATALLTEILAQPRAPGRPEPGRLAGAGSYP